jgi:hypothetical protein
MVTKRLSLGPEAALYGRDDDKQSTMKAIGVVVLIGSLVLAAYFGATGAPAYVHGRILVVAIVGSLMLGRDHSERWVPFIFWSVIYSMVALGIVSTISIWIGQLAGWS